MQVVHEDKFITVKKHVPDNNDWNKIVIGLKGEWIIKREMWWGDMW